MNPVGWTDPGPSHRKLGAGKLEHLAWGDHELEACIVFRLPVRETTDHDVRHRLDSPDSMTAVHDRRGRPPSPDARVVCSAAERMRWGESWFVPGLRPARGRLHRAGRANLMRLATLTAVALDALAQLHLPEYREKVARQSPT